MTDPVDLGAIRSLEALEGRQDEASKREVAREFEALLVGEMTKIASRPVFGESLLGGGSAGKMWQEMYMEQVVRAAAGHFGIADALEAAPGGDDRPEPSTDQSETTALREETK